MYFGIAVYLVVPFREISRLLFRRSYPHGTSRRPGCGTAAGSLIPGGPDSQPPVLLRAARDGWHFGALGPGHNDQTWEPVPVEQLERPKVGECRWRSDLDRRRDWKLGTRETGCHCARPAKSNEPVRSAVPSCTRRGRAGRGLPRPEPGAGSAGCGAPAAPLWLMPVLISKQTSGKRPAIQVSRYRLPGFTICATSTPRHSCGLACRSMWWPPGWTRHPSITLRVYAHVIGESSPRPRPSSPVRSRLIDDRCCKSVNKKASPKREEASDLARSEDSNPQPSDP